MENCEETLVHRASSAHEVELPNRLALAQAVQPSLTEAAVKNMSQADFFRLIHPKLEAGLLSIGWRITMASALRSISQKRLAQLA